MREAATERPEQIALIAGMPDSVARRRWTYAQMWEGSVPVAQALLTRFQPRERFAVWVPNLAELALLEFGAALAGVVLVTVNPPFARKNWSMSSSSQGRQASFSCRSTSMAASLQEIRPNLPLLREVVLFSDWTAFLASGSLETPLLVVASTNAV